MNGLEFDHRVLHPWARNLCFYTIEDAADLWFLGIGVTWDLGLGT
jgi:hypothetical protein